MQVVEFETKMKDDIEHIFNSFLSEHNYTLPISAHARAGAEVSDYLEDWFVGYVLEHTHDRIYNPQGAPKENTKNPFDFCFNYKNEEYHDFDDLVWGDIKAIKSTGAGSNPDLGTPKKVIDFIKDGHFYILYVLVKYKPTKDGYIQLIKFDDEKYVHCVFLKDMGKFRINPKPQFQANITEQEEYRTREEFVKLFYKKYMESVKRNLEKQKKKQKELPDIFAFLENQINEYYTQD